jgi:hypothetical protein
MLKPPVVKATVHELQHADSSGAAASIAPVMHTKKFTKILNCVEALIMPGTRLIDPSLQKSLATMNVNCIDALIAPGMCSTMCSVQASLQATMRPD